MDDELRGAPARGRRRWVALRGSRPAVRSAVLPTLAALVLVLAGAAGCGAGSDEVLARDVPTSGRASPIFAEVDVAMRQLVKWRCAGAGVLAISYRGHRVYSRGFGKLRGSATPETYRGCRDAWDPDAPVTPPETPMRIGSVTKGVVAAIVRPLVAARIVERRPWEFLTEDAEFDALLLDPELELLPASLRRYFHHPSDCPPGLDCAAPPIPSPGDAPPDEVAALCEPEEGADRRWPVVSIGHLLTHRSGLPRSNAQWPEVVPEEFAAIRGYTSRGDFAEAHQLHRAAFGGEAVDHAQELTARALGVATDDLYFVGHYDHRDRMPIDQQLKVLAGRCLVDWPGAKQRYSNSGHVLLGRVVDHLWSEAHGGDPSYSFAGRLGRPEEHAKSALAAFVEEELDLPLEEGGVEARYPIYGHQWFYPRSGLADEPAEPELRRWEDRTYTPRWAPSYHFYCVWRGDRCDASSWAIETLRWRWDLVQGTVPHWAGMHSDHYASGGLMAEPSAMLELVNRYQIGRGVKAGLPRPSWANGTSHGGSITGGRAFLGRHGGVQVRVDLPPRDEDGRITDDFDDLEEVQIQPTRGVAFFVGVAQQDDARCGDECDEAYEAFENVIRYVLARVDWDDVRHMIDGRRRRVVGLLSDGSDAGGRPIAWYADGRVGVGDRAWGDYAGEGVAGEATPGRLPKFGSYRLPSTRIGDDVLGITVAPDGTFIALFADGRAGLGALIDEGAGPRPHLDRARPRRFALPEGVEPGMIVAFAAAPDGELVTWLSDQTYLRGDVEDLSSRGRGDYRLPRERAPDELADATIDADGSVRALFDDGALIVGQIDDLRAIARPAAVVGVARAADGERLVVHDNGHVRAVDPEGLALGVGRVALEVPPEPGRDLAPLYASEDVVAVATDPAGIVYVWLRGGVGLMGEARLLADEQSRLGLVDADLYLEAFTWAGDPEQIVDVAFRGDGEVVVWRRDGRLVDAVLDDLRGGPARPFAVADDRLIDELVGVTIDEAGVAHARYRDGSWSAGTPEALGEPAG